MGSRRPGYYQPREDWDVPVLQQVNSQLEMYLKSLPGGSELSLSELQDMASRQQLQIDNQQQVLVAKEQRLKYLKQQEMKHAQMSAENERLRKLKEKVESQEMKLKKLRALRGQVEQYKMNNGNLTSELEGIKSLFNEKEKELAMAVAKVEELTSQLEMLRSGKAVNFDPNNSPAALELEKLRKELMLRNKLNEQQNANIVAHREMLGQRRDEISQMDRRISDLQQRLKKKKAQQGVGPNYSLNNNNNFMGNKTVTRNGGTNVAAVEPYIKHAPKDVTKDDLHTNYSFERQDPKHQTLPPNLKFPYPEKGRVIENNGDSIKNNNQTNGSAESAKDYNVPLVVTVDSSKTPLNGVQESSGDLSKPGHVSRPIHSQALPSQPPQPNKYSAPSTRAGMGIANFTPKPFGSTYSTSMLSGRPFTPGTSQPVVSAGGEVRTGGSGQSSPATSDNGLPVSNQSQHSQHSHVSSPSDSSSHPSKPVYSTAKLNYGGPSHSGVSYPQPSAPALSRDSKSSTVPLKPGNSAYSHPAVSVSERGPTLPPRQSSTSSNSSITPFSQSSKHPMQTPLQRPSQRVPTTPPTSVTSAAPTTVSDSSSPPKPSSNSGAPVPSTSSTRQGHSAAQSVLSNHRWPRSSADTRTSPANPPSSTATTTAPSRGRLLSGNTNPPVSNGSVNVPTSSPNGGATAKPETTQASVTSALNALLQPGAAGQNLRGPRYASKSVIANTYTRKLGSGAMEQYRKNMSKLYQGFGEQGQTKSPEQPSSDNKTTESGKAPGSESSEQKSPVFGDVVDSSHPTRTGHPQPHGAASKPHHHSGLNSNSTLSQYTSDKPSFKAMSPKHLRRRHSDSSDNEEVQLKLPQKRAEATPASKSLTQPSETLPGVSESSAGASSSESVHVPDRLLIDNLGNVLEVSDGTDLSVTSAQNEVFGQSSEDQVTPKAPVVIETNKVKRRLKTNLKSKSSSSKSPNRRVSFDPLALLLDASLEGELDLVRRVAKEVPDVSASNDEGITALHNAICAGHYDIVKYLVEFGSDANAPDSDGWTPLHCAASCNNLPMVKLLVEHGACIFATTISDHETAAEKCEEDEDGYDGCSEYLYSIQEKLGIINNGVVFAVFDYKSQNADELSFRVNSQITVLRKGDDKEKEWWWSRIRDREGYVPRNLLGLSRRVIPDRGKP